MNAPTAFARSHADDVLGQGLSGDEPGRLGRTQQGGAGQGRAGLTVTIAECPPGDSSGLHKHTATVENFFCIQGSFDITWGDERRNMRSRLSRWTSSRFRRRLSRVHQCGHPIMGRLVRRDPVTRGRQQDTVIHSARPVKRSSAAGARTPATPWPGSVSSSGSSRPNQRMAGPDPGIF